MEEIWKDVIGFEGYYQVSSIGNVKSLPREIIRGTSKNPQYTKERLLRLVIDTHGYLRVCLQVKGIKKKIKRVHQLVAESFLNHIPNKITLVVNHINHDKLDNRVKNLEIVTNRVNCSLHTRTTSSKYVGVCFHKGAKKWQASIKTNGKSLYLGQFNTEEEAYEVYQKELYRILKAAGLQEE